MKRKILCVFALIAYLLVFCTLLSPKVEEEMQTQVEVKKTYGEKILNRNMAVPASALTWSDEDEQIFQVVEGKGWQTGDRVQEISRWSYTIIYSMWWASDSTVVHKEPQRVEINPGKNFSVIIAASRQPQVGDQVQVITEFETRDDTYIIYYPKGAENLESYPNSFAPLAQSDQALIVQPTKAQAPFFESSVLVSLKNMNAEELRAFSVADISQFYKMLPLIAGVALILVWGVFLWGYSCVLIHRPGRKRLVLRNGVAGIALLCLMPVLVGMIDLPASLMPEENIFDIAHYRSEFSQIFSALKSAGSDLLTQERTAAAWSVAGILLAGVILPVVLVWLDRKIKKKNSNLS